eukprot:jgi/Tetstr1/430058/TSEL_019918.t1
MLPFKKAGRTGSDAEGGVEVWLRYVQSSKGVALCVCILALLVLIGQEVRGGHAGAALGDPVLGASPSLGRRGAAFAWAAHAETGSAAPGGADCPVAQLQDEISVLYAQIRRQEKNIADLRAENMQLSDQLHLSTGAHAAGRRGAAQTAAVPAAAAPAEPGDGGPSGTEFPGYQYFKGQDFDGEDLAHEAALEDNLPALARKCQQMPECQAFNSQGWLKRSLKPYRSWYTWTHLDNKGIFVKQEYAANMQ